MNFTTAFHNVELNIIPHSFEKKDDIINQIQNSGKIENLIAASQSPSIPEFNYSNKSDDFFTLLKQISNTYPSISITVKKILLCPQVEDLKPGYYDLFTICRGECKGTNGYDTPF